MRRTDTPSIETHPYRVGDRFYKRLYNAIKASEQSTSGGGTGLEVFKRLPPRDPSSYFAQDRWEGRELIHVPSTARADIIENNIDGYWRANQGGARDGGTWTCSPHILEREIPLYARFGTLIIDKRAALERDPMLAYRAPMYQIGLTGFNRFEARYPGIRESLASMEPALGGSFATLARLHIADPKAVSFDYCGAAEYAAWWAAQGATVKRFPW